MDESTHEGLLSQGDPSADPGAPSGDLRFVTHDESVRLRGALDAARLLVVDLGDVGPGARGRLSETIDDAVEAAIRQRGGAPPGIGAGSDADASLSDQLYRLRQIGRVGLAVCLGPLTALVDDRGLLPADDGASLRFLATATRDRPMVLLLDRANENVRVHGAPVPLPEALQGTRAKEPPPPEKKIERARPPAPVRVEEPRPARRVPSVEVPADTGESRALVDGVALLRGVTRATPLSGLEKAFVDGYAPLRTALLEDRLGQAGLSRNDVRTLCTSFSAVFAKAYAEAMPTFGVTGRHPRMIFELFDVAQRCARVHGARATHVVIVDSLRWDLGRRLRERMARTLARKAVCVEEQVMWALLPTTTAVQLDAIVRGEDAIRAPARPERETSIVRGRSLDVLRRMRLGHRDVVKLDLAEGRLREVGPTERERLDTLSDEIEPILSRYIASSPNRTLVVVAGDHGFAFGDCDEPRDERLPTPPARQGGGSPDEVFVPFAAWLVGGVH